jgi:hypothetical protein
MKSFEISLPTKKQALDILKVTVYLSLSAGLDYLISISTGTIFGIYTAPINVLLVTIKKVFTKG